MKPCMIFLLTNFLLSLLYRTCSLFPFSPFCLPPHPLTPLLLLSSVFSEYGKCLGYLSAALQRSQSYGFPVDKSNDALRLRQHFKALVDDLQAHYARFPFLLSLSIVFFHL